MSEQVTGSARRPPEAPSRPQPTTAVRPGRAQPPRRHRAKAGNKQEQLTVTPGPLIPIWELARLANLSVATLRRMVRRGEIPAVNIGRNVRVSPAAWQAYLEAHRVKGRPQPRRPSLGLPRSKAAPAAAAE